MKRSLAVFLSWAALAACSIAPLRRGEPVRTYVLELDAASIASAAQHTPATLLLSPIGARPGFDTPRMAYFLRPHELCYFASNEWADTPARMMDRLLQAALKKDQAWGAVLPNAESMRGDYRLDADDFAVAQEFLTKPSRVRVTLNARLVELKGGAVVRTGGFEVVENAPSDDPYGGVIAANRAATRLAQEAALWLASPLPPPPSGP